MPGKLDITVLSGVSTGDVFHFDLSAGSEVVIGRAQDCDLVLQDPLVSRRHAKVVATEEGFALVDLGSTHGTTHMGFRLGVGDAEKRALHPEEEFKVGDSLFRASFELVKKKSEAKVAAASGPKKSSLLQNKKVRYAGLVVGLLLLVYILLPAEKKGLPPQLSDSLLSMPQYRVIGHYRDGKTPAESDRAHIDRAQFSLPASDLVIEYEYRADAPLKVMLDQSLLEELPAETSGWSRRVILSRDIASGVERRLVFDNPDFPRAPGKGGPLKQWGVRDARVTPMTRDHTSSFDALLNTAIVTSEKIRVTPDGMYNFLRLLQRLTLEGMRELNLDSLPYEISPALEPPDPVDIRLQLDSIRNERARNLSSSSISSHMNLLTKIVASLDSELWRKVSISLLRAEREASVKQYIEAYDILTGIQEMFPEREERRWVLAEALLSNKKIVPTRVRKNPNKFRKK